MLKHGIQSPTSQSLHINLLSLRFFSLCLVWAQTIHRLLCNFPFLRGISSGKCLSISLAMPTSDRHGLEFPVGYLKIKQNTFYEKKIIVIKPLKDLAYNFSMKFGKWNFVVVLSAIQRMCIQHT